MTNPTQATLQHEESTYQLLVESEEKGRGVFEAVIYLLLVLAAIATIVQFGREPITIAEIGVNYAQKVAAVYL